MRALIVTAEGLRPDGPIPWANKNTSCAATSSGVLPSGPKNRCNNLE